MKRTDQLTRRAPKSSFLDQYCAQFKQGNLRRAKITSEKALRMEAEQAAQLKSNFIATMSHELRTPLNAIIGFANLLITLEGRSSDPAKVEESATYIKDAGHQLLDTINKMLDLSKIQSGAVPFEEEVIDVCYIIERSLNMLSFDAEKAGISLNPAKDVPHCEAIGDETRATQIINNIISNAIKYNKPGGRVDIALRQTETAVEVIISDTGIGMSQDELEIALTPFGRVHSVYTQSVDGTGLGLCVAKELMEFQGGHMKIESQKDNGTVVTLSFQIHASEQMRVHAA